MNIILTPVYKSFDTVIGMCQQIDALTELPYLHILIDDDSGENIPIAPSDARRILQIRRDVPGVIHKNGGGQAIQLGLDYSRQSYCNEGLNQPIDHVFVIESDVIVQEQGWDRKQIEISKTLPSNWGTLDVQSVDEEGKVTYPCTVSPRHDEWSDPDFEWLHYPDFQCTLFNGVALDIQKFSDYPSHFDVLFGRVMERHGLKAYRSKQLKALHVKGGFNSRQFLK